MLQCVAVCCSVLQCVAVLILIRLSNRYVAVCCRVCVWVCVTVCYRVFVFVCVCVCVVDKANNISPSNWQVAVFCRVCVSVCLVTLLHSARCGVYVYVYVAEKASKVRFSNSVLQCADVHISEISKCESMRYCDCKGMNESCHL